MGMVYGVGFNDKKYPISKNGRLIKPYNAWRNMLLRCYKTKLAQPTYMDCTVSEDFKIYSNFHEWFLSQVGSCEDGYELDKDLLHKKNTVYSPERCILIPREVNMLLTKRQALRGDLPIGVHFHKPLNRFRAQINKGGRRCHIGYYQDPIDAFNAYKKEKEEHIVFLAEKYRGRISSRAYNALIAYKVEFTD